MATSKDMGSAQRRRGGIYARFSKDSRDATKIEDQIAMCRRLADSNDIDIVDVYNEGSGVSAFTFVERPVWDQMLRDVRDGKLDILIAQSEDRFARQPLDKENLQLVCAAAGVTWHTVNEGQTDPATADGEFMSHMRVGLARMESRRKAERQRQRNLERRLRGESPRGGTRPFGYGVPRNGDWENPSTRTIRRMVEGTGKDGIEPEYEAVEVIDYDLDQIHPVEAPLVAAAYQYVLDLPDGTGLSTIKTVFNHFKITTVNGNEWDLPKVEKVLRRGRNAGYVEHRHKDSTGKLAVWPAKVLDADGNPIRGGWETIVDEATYAAVMAKLENPERALKRPREARHLMSSLAKCCCGVKLRTSGRNQGKGDGREAAYRCGVHQNAAEKIPGVRHVSIGCEELDSIATRAVIDALIHAPRASRPEPEAAKLHQLHVDLTAVGRAQMKLLDLVEDDDLDFDPALIKAKGASLRAKAEQIRSEIEDIAKANAQAELLATVTVSLFEDEAVDAFGVRLGGRRVSFDKVAKLRADLLTKFNALSLHQRRALVRSYIDVTVTHGRGAHRVKVLHLVATDLNEDDR